MVACCIEALMSQVSADAQQTVVVLLVLYLEMKLTAVDVI
jgi:hypothetical protein